MAQAGSMEFVVLPSLARDTCISLPRIVSGRSLHVADISSEAVGTLDYLVVVREHTSIGRGMLKYNMKHCTSVYTNAIASPQCDL